MPKGSSSSPATTRSCCDDAARLRVRRGGAAGPRILEGQGLSVRRRPLDPGRPIDYASLSTCALVEGVTAEPAAPATRPVTPTGSETPRRQPGTPSATASARVDAAVAALCRSVDAARSAYEERSAQLEGAVPRFAFDAVGGAVRSGVGARRRSRPRGGRPSARPGRKHLPAVARLSPDDADTIGELADLSPSRPLTVVADPTVEPGGAMVEIGSTTIDSQLSRALERVRAVIVGQPEGDPR